MSEDMSHTLGKSRPIGRFTPPPPQVLQISVNNGPVDELAARALTETGARFEKSKGKEVKGVGFGGTTEAALAYIRENGLSTHIGRLTTSINRSGIDDTSRRLLAAGGVYAYLLLRALKEDKVKSDDIEGLRYSVMLHLSDDDASPMAVLVKSVVAHVLKEGKIELDANLEKRLNSDLRRAGISLAKGKLKPAVLSLLTSIKDDGDLPDFVNDFFLKRKEVEPTITITDSIRNGIVRHLRALGVRRITREQFEAGKFDEYFAVAYDSAMRASTGEQDPLTMKYSAAGSAAMAADWDFSVDDFSTMAEQGVVKDNIVAAGAAYYVYELGERLGIYRLADSLVLRWASGVLDLADGEAASLLYRYWKLRDDRSPEQERGLLYKRALNIGETEVLSRMIVNEDFPVLWHRLMEEVTRYIEKYEKSVELDAAGSKVSRSAIYESVRNLQFNLTEHMTGMAHMLVREMYAHFRDALAILGHEDIVDFFGGGARKNLWTVIAKLSAEEFRSAPNISAIRTSAVEGNHVFQFISKFDGFASVREEDFRSFLESAEAWILAQGSMGEDEVVPDDDAEDPDTFEDEESSEDEWDA
jgi:hypothetical protein